MRRLLMACAVAGVLAIAAPAIVQPLAAQATQQDTTKKKTKKSKKETAGTASVATGPATDTKSDTTARSGGTAPPDATAQCKDGTYTTAKSKRGACSGHGGIAAWLADAGTKKPAESKSKGSSGTAAPVAPAPPASPAPATAAPATAAPPTRTPPAAAPAPQPNATNGESKSKSSRAQIVAPPANAPANATAQCKDGTFSFAKQHRGACAGHGGVAAWFK